LSFDNLSFEIVEEIVVEIELPLERSVGHTPSALEYGENLVEYFIEVHLNAPYQGCLATMMTGFCGFPTPAVKPEMIVPHRVSA
jgi:hypothetical protein